jgi:peptidoglycan/xylan/chitin deacetylase (PgdA/CDA1 family)
MGPVLYRTPRPGRHRRWRTARLLLVLLLLAVSATTVTVRGWTTPRRPAVGWHAGPARPARSRRLAPGSPAHPGPAGPACPPAALHPRPPGQPVGTGRRPPPAGVRHSPWVRYHLPIARQAAKRVALTFDDGPDPRYTPRILRVLAHMRTPTTFFMVGRQAAAHPQLVRRVAQAGQQIGGHTWNHRRLDRLPPARVAAEVDCTDRLLSRLTGRPVRLLRPPMAPMTGRWWTWPPPVGCSWSCGRPTPGTGRVRGSARSWPQWPVSCARGRSSCCTTAAATAPRPWPRCPGCCACCTSAATGRWPWRPAPWSRAGPRASDRPGGPRCRPSGWRTLLSEFSAVRRRL